MGYSLLSMKWDDGLAQGEVWLSAPEKEQEFRLISHRRWVSKQLEDAWEQRRLLSFALQLWHLHVLGAASSGTGQGCSGAPRWSHSMAFTAIYSLLPNLWGHFIVQLLSRDQLFATLWTAVLQASLFFTMSQSLLRFMSIESVMHPTISSSVAPFSPLATNLSQHQGPLHLTWDRVPHMSYLPGFAHAAPPTR